MCNFNKRAYYKKGKVGGVFVSVYKLLARLLTKSALISIL